MSVKILIVEDEPAIQELLAFNITQAGFRALRAEDAESAWKQIGQDLPDLILLDINMPYKSGLECLGEIKERGYDTKIIVQTAYTFSEEREKYLGLGCHGYIAKPVSKRDLFLTIHEVLNS